jgi:hypothetical protein
MTDLSDVEQAIADAITSILYPDGRSQPSAIGSVCRVYRGWPNATTLNADLGAGTINVTVVADNDSGRITTRYIPEWQVHQSEPGTQVHVTNNTIVVTGRPAAGDVVGALIENHVYVYRIKIGDTADLVAGNLGCIIESKASVNVTGSTITIPGAASVCARSVCDKTISYEGRRQEKDMRIIFWCHAPLIRDNVVSIVDGSLSGISFLKLTNDAAARLTYKNTSSYDQAQNALLYRRDLIYTVEYPTIVTTRAPSMLFGASNLNENITYA